MAYKYFKHTIAKGTDVDKALADIGTEGMIVRTDSTASGETHVYFASHTAPKQGKEVPEAEVKRIGD
jgi:hypothetical protein